MDLALMDGHTVNKLLDDKKIELVTPSFVTGLAKEEQIPEDNSAAVVRLWGRNRGSLRAAGKLEINAVRTPPGFVHIQLDNHKVHRTSEVTTLLEYL